MAQCKPFNERILTMITLDWVYLYMKSNGDGLYTLVDDEGHEANINWPDFKNRGDADKYLVDNDIRASIVGDAL